MAGAKLFVCYPHPKDTVAFEKAYAEEHLPLAGPILARAGAQNAGLRGCPSRPRASRISIGWPRSTSHRLRG